MDPRYKIEISEISMKNCVSHHGFERVDTKASDPALGKEGVLSKMIGRRPRSSYFLGGGNRSNGLVVIKKSESFTPKIIPFSQLLCPIKLFPKQFNPNL